MFIAWGSSTKVLQGPQLPDQPCEACGVPRAFRLVLQYRVQQFVYLFRWVTAKAYHKHCLVCGRSVPVDYAEAQRGRSKNPIPFFDRLGWAVGAGGLVALAVLGSVGAALDRQADEGLIASPHVNDIYEVNAARMSRTPEAAMMYTVLRVQRVTPQFVEFHPASTYYDTERGVERDIRSGAVNRSNYYSAETGTLPLAELRRMHADGTIIDVIR